MSITYSEHVFVALDIQQAMRTRHIVISGLAGSYYISTIFVSFSHKRRDYRKKKVIEHETCVLIFSTTVV